MTQFKVMSWSRAKGPKSHQPWAPPKVLDITRNQALKARQPHTLDAKQCGWLISEGVRRFLALFLGMTFVGGT
jgi:hypothetical protein